MSNEIQLPVSFVWSRSDNGYVVSDAGAWFVALAGSKKNAKLICDLINNQGEKK